MGAAVDTIVASRAATKSESWGRIDEYDVQLEAHEIWGVADVRKEQLEWQ